MILSRLMGLIFRFGEFVCAAVVLGLMSLFLHQYHHTKQGPLAREIYIEVIAIISVFMSLIWMIPFTASLMHYPFDLLMSAAWFAAFGLLVDLLHNMNCGAVFHWAGLTNAGACNQWKAAEAFTFIGACFWLASALLGIYVFHHLRGPAVVDAPPPRRRRWGRRHYV